MARKINLTSKRAGEPEPVGGQAVKADFRCGLGDVFLPVASLACFLPAIGISISLCPQQPSKFLSGLASVSRRTCRTQGSMRQQVRRVRGSPSRHAGGLG